MLFLLSLYFLTSCTEKNNVYYGQNVQTIINGQPADGNPLTSSVVGILRKIYLNDGDFTWMMICAGTVLNSRMIMTASHCVAAVPESDLLVSFSNKGLPFSKQAPKETRKSFEQIEKEYPLRGVKKYIANESFHYSAEGDIAVLLLDRAAPENTVPVQILSSEEVTKLDKNITVTLLGFGYMQEDPNVESEILRITTLPARFEQSIVITDQKISGACMNDSGGPAFLMVEGQYYQVGITHGPYGESQDCSQEGAFLNPSYMLPFIRNAESQLLKSF